MLIALPTQPFLCPSSVAVLRLQPPRNSNKAVVVAFKSGLPPSSPGEPRAEPAGPLRGLDVLQALQQAAVRKEKKKRQKQKKHGNRRKEEEVDSDTDSGTGHVRPIEIRSDWGPRLDDLEKRVHQLLAQRH